MPLRGRISPTMPLTHILLSSELRIVAKMPDNDAHVRVTTLFTGSPPAPVLLIYTRTVLLTDTHLACVCSEG